MLQSVGSQGVGHDSATEKQSLMGSLLQSTEALRHPLILSACSFNLLLVGVYFCQ